MFGFVLQPVYDILPVDIFPEIMATSSVYIRPSLVPDAALP